MFWPEPEPGRYLRGDGDLAGRAGQRFLGEGRFRRLLPGPGQLDLDTQRRSGRFRSDSARAVSTVTAYLLGPDQHQVVAGLGAGVAAAGQRQQAGPRAGRAGPRVAAVGLPVPVVAAGGQPAGRDRADDPPDLQNRRPGTTPTCRAPCSAAAWCCALGRTEPPEPTSRSCSGPEPSPDTGSSFLGTDSWSEPDRLQRSVQPGPGSTDTWTRPVGSEPEYS